jgi:serpin B
MIKSFKKTLMVCLILLSSFIVQKDISGLDDDIQRVVSSNNKFALKLYTGVAQGEGNLFISPFSISSALAMAYAGARGNTEAQMADVLHFDLPQERLHPAFYELMQDLRADPEKASYELAIANALWGQIDYEFYQEYIKITEDFYDAGFKEVDFIKERESTRLRINRWVEIRTKDKIKDLIAEDMLNELTRLVLTNAIYFKGKWAFPFDEETTKDDLFTLREGEKVPVPMMHQTRNFNYTENETFQALEMPYLGEDLSMVIFLPKKIDGLRELEEMLTERNIENWCSRLKKTKVITYIPKFKMSSKFSLAETLKLMGMKDAFDSKLADFSGMTPDPVGLYIFKVMHKAFVDVNEEGTEAAAATSVFYKARWHKKEPPKPVFRADHPFIFIIRDMRSESILFMGRLMDPREYLL